ncbi:hypothetical protein UFOVP273_29 [uncultured Caudovirales phage]|uniref:Uncharacterized protein n=1 Tax=uncultured Caudovirales phage TaxID=2100421 RepID=A0A6J5LHZ5_9CAUD|nr:hypothetical protein UFOVP273_29 [uncultured Caudovirales phage]
MSNYDKFINDSTGKELLKKHSLNEKGVWRVRGGDSNCDLGGTHYMPELGIFEGRLQDVLEYAVDIKRFWSWGPGDITKVTITKIDQFSAENRRKLLARKAELEAELKAIGERL